MLAPPLAESRGKDRGRSVYDKDAEPEEKPSFLQRFGFPVALLVVVLVVGYLLLFTGHEYTLTAEFENASQLTIGNQVVIGGAPVGKVKEIKLGDDGQALVSFTVDDDFQPLPRGTTATVRSYSLSGLANRQVQLTLPPDNKAGEPIPDGGTMTQAETVSEVDL